MPIITANIALATENIIAPLQSQDQFFSANNQKILHII